MGSSTLSGHNNSDTIPGENYSIKCRTYSGQLLQVNGKSSRGETEPPAPRVFRRRWLVLAVFALYSLSNSYQWIHMNIIGNIVKKYYNESLPSDPYQRDMSIDMLSLTYMIVYIPLIIPSTWFLNKMGLQMFCLTGGLINVIGSWLKCASVSPDRFPLLVFAQVLCSVSNLFILNVPPRLSAVWFGRNEVSTATSIGVLSNQVGIAIGFLVPPIIVPNTNDMGELHDNFILMFYTTAGVATLSFILIILFFKKEPPEPPSRAQQLAVEAERDEDYKQSLIRLASNKNFIVLVISYGINTGAYYALGTLLNPEVLEYFPKEEENAGRIGLTMVLTGIAGSLAVGPFLDKTKTFKATTIGIYIMSVVSMVAFTITLQLKLIWVVFITIGALGLFQTGYLPVGFEFGAELTFPESEGTSSGLLNVSAQIFGVAFTLSLRALMNSVSVRAANSTLAGFMFVGLIMTTFIAPDYRRQMVEREAFQQEIYVENPTTQGASVNNNNDLEDRDGSQNLVP